MFVASRDKRRFALVVRGLPVGQVYDLRGESACLDRVNPLGGTRPCQLISRTVTVTRPFSSRVASASPARSLPSSRNVSGPPLSRKFRHHVFASGMLTLISTSSPERRYATGGLNLRPERRPV